MKNKHQEEVTHDPTHHKCTWRRPLAANQDSSVHARVQAQDTGMLIVYGSIHLWLTTRHSLSADPESCRVKCGGRVRTWGGSEPASDYGPIHGPGSIIVHRSNKSQQLKFHPTILKIRIFPFSKMTFLYLHSHLISVVIPKCDISISKWLN